MNNRQNIKKYVFQRIKIFENLNQIPGRLYFMYKTGFYGYYR